MPLTIQTLLKQYTDALKNIYGEHLRTVILYGSYARGDFRQDSDIDIMILVDLDELDIKNYRHKLSELTYDFNMDYDLDIKPMTKNEVHFKKWLGVYPFYANVQKEGVRLYGTA